MATNKKSVELGFVVEETENKRRLLSHFFPSKIGGKPAWLSLKPLPSPDDLKCSVCKTATSFLLQAYAPINVKDSCFHRTLFVFICRNPACCKPNKNGNILVFRSQLARKNEFYSDKAPDDKVEDENSPNAEMHQTLCAVCGCAGSKKCGKCQQVNYCSKEHQVADWNNGHKAVCGQTEQSEGATQSVKEPISSVVFKEYELDYGCENYDEADDDDDDDDKSDDDDEDKLSKYMKKNKKKKEKSNEERMEEYRKYLAAAGKDGKDGMMSVAELEKMALTDEDTTFTKFKKRVAADPEQVLRYDKGGEPLCITDKPAPPQPADLPKCSYCGGQRKFEFQIMPQLLTYLDVDCGGLGDETLDWGVLAVYTCSESCDKGGVYGKEYVWKQDIVAPPANKSNR